MSLRATQTGRAARASTAIAAAIAGLLLTACANTPVYERPSVSMPAAWQVQAPWREGVPADGAARGAWWRRFDDPDLDGLMQRALAASPTLQLATARLAQARASADAAASGLFPQVALGSRVARQRISANRPLTNYNAPNLTTIQNDYAVSFTVAYEVDLWGRARGTADVGTVTAQQAAADLENVRLVLTADVAANYFNLRELDIELDVLARSIALQRRALELATARYELGATSGLDVAQQQALLDNTLTQVDVLRRQRDQFEHALATLTGTPAPVFAVAAQIRPRAAPAIPIGVPSDLLQRRPDVASAERAVAAANAQIGVARAAYFPSVTLAPVVGADSRNIATLLDVPSFVWSMGVALAMPIFDGGRTDANVAGARAAHEATVANYRRTVLLAMQEVEDGITGSAALDRALAQAQKAVQSAEAVLRIADDRYQGGVATYVEVITAQQSLLNAQRQAAQLLGQRMLVAVFLVKALGGDWSGPEGG